MAPKGRYGDHNEVLLCKLLIAVVIKFTSALSHKELKDAWIKAIRQEGWQPTKTSAVCSQHFRPEDLDYTGQTRMLRDGPSVFPAYPKCLQTTKGLIPSVCLSIDYMCLKEHVEFDGKRIIEYVDMGTEIENDSLPTAKMACIIMCTSINAYWKIPCGYFFADYLSGSERGFVVKSVLKLLHCESCKNALVDEKSDCPFIHFKNKGGLTIPSADAVEGGAADADAYEVELEEALWMGADGGVGVVAAAVLGKGGHSQLPAALSLKHQSEHTLLALAVHESSSDQSTNGIGSPITESATTEQQLSEFPGASAGVSSVIQPNLASTRISTRSSSGLTKFLIGCVYIPPKSSSEIYESHCQTVENILSTNSFAGVSILGDYNLPNFIWSDEPWNEVNFSNSNVAPQEAAFKILGGDGSGGNDTLFLHSKKRRNYSSKGQAQVHAAVHHPLSAISHEHCKIKKGESTPGGN
ncbi:hypothetical protein J437_LFUL009739 [Ladona fulva]|uniref:THAP-type domain-containing protein n=1 Tax=Ladona fulva TaxID=123851 RepID=A0A8K0P151_LADFU|nr:hypothetical protein J437_LFUL009739 [Ladona fulva]